MIIGDPNRRAIETLKASARTGRSVLLTGPTGSGKTFLANKYGRGALILDGQRALQDVTAEHLRSVPRFIAIADAADEVHQLDSRVMTIVIGQTMHAELGVWTEGMAAQFLRRHAKHLTREWVRRVARRLRNPRVLQGLAINSRGMADDTELYHLFRRFAPTVAVPVTLHACRLQAIAEAACEIVGVDLETVLSPGRTAAACRDRHLVWWLCRQVGRPRGVTLIALGTTFKRDHASVLHGVNKVQSQRHADDNIRAETDAMAATLEEHTRAIAAEALA